MPILVAEKEDWCSTGFAGNVLGFTIEMKRIDVKL